MTKVERIVEFLERMIAAPPASSASSAFDLITKTFVAVEEEMVSDDDPMFPPSGDFYYDIEGRDDLLLFRQAGHETIIRVNGAILIRNRKTKAVSLDKPGHDGKKVDL
ncbi:MAG TPA: hypothetical protein VF469_13320 [Kofleriaceae bacterium]